MSIKDLSNKNKGDVDLPCTSSLSIDDLHFKLRTIFFDEMKEHWVEDDMIHMDYVSDAFDKTILLFLEDCTQR